MSRTWYSVASNQWQGNVIQAEKYIYNDSSDFENVIVGSSLSYRLVIDSFPKTYNLSFGGQSIYEGLAILLKTKRAPKTVLVEMNVALRGEDKNFSKSLFNPISFTFKKRLASLREDKQPLVILGRLLDLNIVQPGLKSIKNHISGSSAKMEGGTADKALFDKMLAMQHSAYVKEPKQETIAANFDILKSYVLQLEKRGVNVVFFEMPVDSSLRNLASANAIRNAFYNYFPQTEYKYILPPADKNYSTVDGVHLKGEEANAYSSYLSAKFIDKKMAPSVD
jgi:hypothetical protein